MSTFLLAGCGQEENQKVTTRNETDTMQKVAANQSEKPAAKGLNATSSGSLEVIIKPENPVADDCLEASVKQGLSDKTLIWAVNGIEVQQESSNRYCLEEGVRRGDVVSVSVTNSTSSGNASVTLGNSLPRVLDTTLEFIAEGGDYSLEITPHVADADEDYVELSYQWLINGQINEAYTENRLPSDAYRKSDKVQVNIIPDDGYGRGHTYTSRNITLPGAAPVVTSQPPKAFEAMEYTYQVEATDANNSELTFKLENAPQGMSIDAQTGLILWPLDDVSPGDYQVRIIVIDPDGNSGGQKFNLNLGKRKMPEQPEEKK
jgi:hypothetical protein